MSSYGNVTHVLASAVANDATVAIAYPTGQTRASLAATSGGAVTINDGAFGAWHEGAGGALISFGASTITITNKSGVTWPAGATLIASFGDTPRNGSYNTTIGQAAGQAAPSAPVLELTASAAIPPYVGVVELNHASVVIAATLVVVPNSRLIIKDTSATGTVAHTVTLTGGTFNGTNTVATLNARDEFLEVHFDSAGRGQVIANVGAVALS